MPSVPQTDSSRRRMFAIGCLLAVATLALYYPVGHYPFANADDDSYISDNAHVKYGFEPDTVTWAFTTVSDAPFFSVVVCWQMKSGSFRR